MAVVKFLLLSAHIFEIILLDYILRIRQFTHFKGTFSDFFTNLPIYATATIYQLNSFIVQVNSLMLFIVVP